MRQVALPLEFAEVQGEVVVLGGRGRRRRGRGFGVEIKIEVEVVARVGRLGLGIGEGFAEQGLLGRTGRLMALGILAAEVIQRQIEVLAVLGGRETLVAGLLLAQFVGGGQRGGPTAAEATATVAMAG